MSYVFAAPNPVAVGTQTEVFGVATDSESGVTDGEYYIGGDPGEGNGTAMALDQGLLVATMSAPAAGIYEVGVRARDGAGNWSARGSFTLVVYDPSGGFATGAGWIVPGQPGNSEPGDQLPGLDGSSRATFGFLVKYQSGSSTQPGGNLQFRYQQGHFRLQSTGMDWLVVTNSNWARFQGSGTIDGLSEVFPFRVDARDGENGQADRLTIRIWAPGDDPDASEPIYKASGDVGAGSISIQRP